MKRLNLTKHDKINFSIVGIISIILFYCLVVNPALGKADNGDFGRMFLMSGLLDKGTTYKSQYDSYFHLVYRIAHPGFLLPWFPNVVLGNYIAKIALAMNNIFNISNPSYFDIRFLGVIYSIIFITGIYLIIKNACKTILSKIVVGTFIILFFTDGIYISYFNSFFGEATTISFMFLMIGTFMYLIHKTNPSKRDFVIFFITSCCFLTSKTQQLPLLLFMWIIYFALFKFYKEYKKLIIKGSIAVTLICAGVFVSIGDYTNKNNMYQAVFTGILYDTDTPEEDLKQLGLDPKYACLKGTNFYSENLKYDPLGEDMLENFYPKMSLGKLLMFYIKNPDRAYEKIKISAENAYSFNKIDKHSYPKGQYTDNKLTNNFRYNLIQTFPGIHRNLFIFIGFTTIYLITIAIYFFKSKDKKIKLITLLLLFLLASGASQLVLPVLGSGQADFGKHLFLINLSYDILIGTVLLWLCNLIIKFKNRKHI